MEENIFDASLRAAARSRPGSGLVHVLPGTSCRNEIDFQDSSVN